MKTSKNIRALILIDELEKTRIKCEVKYGETFIAVVLGDSKKSLETLTKIFAIVNSIPGKGRISICGGVGYTKETLTTTSINF